jgi:2-oxoisovalerate dehydrogenase E1 component beta subunit
MEVEVIDLRSIYPLDIDTVLSSVGKTNKAMIVYEDNKFLGVGAEVAAQIAEKALFELDGPIVRIGGPHVPAMPYSPSLEHWFLPDAERIEQEMRKLIEF